MGRRSMRPDSESLCAQWRWFLIRLLILIGILYLLFGCIFGTVSYTHLTLPTTSIV